MLAVGSEAEQQNAAELLSAVSQMENQSRQPADLGVLSFKSMMISKRLSLRTALLAMTLLCLVSAWLGLSEGTEDHRRAAVEVFQARGSRISLSRIDGGWWAYSPKMFRPWQSHISLNNTPVDSKGWKQIDRMNCRIVGLKLNGTEYGDSDLRVIAGLSSFQTLQDVGFYGTNVTNEGILQFQQALPSCIVHSHKALRPKANR